MVIYSMVLQVVSINFSLEHPLFDNEDRPLRAVQFYIWAFFVSRLIRLGSFTLDLTLFRECGIENRKQSFLKHWNPNAFFSIRNQIDFFKPSTMSFAPLQRLSNSVGRNYKSIFYCILPNLFVIMSSYRCISSVFIWSIFSWTSFIWCFCVWSRDEMGALYDISINFYQMTLFHFARF